jgi:uncharacterized protein (DUF305 family)
MKNIISLFKNLESFSFLFGMAFGAAIGLVLFSFLVPSGPRMIGMYRSYRMNTLVNSNQNAIQEIFATTTQVTGLQQATAPAVTRPTSYAYSTAKITSEKQFLQIMKSHHETDVLMATQMLILKPTHPEVVTLANNIISTQNTELKLIRDWLNAWK